MRWLTLRAALATLLTGRHHYLSTSCAHADHVYCARPSGAAGPKIPARCKFCTARCICPCHRKEPGRA